MASTVCGNGFSAEFGTCGVNRAVVVVACGSGRSEH